MILWLLVLLAVVLGVIPGDRPKDKATLRGVQASGMGKITCMAIPIEPGIGNLAVLAIPKQM